METQRPLNFFQSLTELQKTKLRAYEKVCLKTIDTQNALRFNNNCIGEKLCPETTKKHYLFFVGSLS